MGNSLSIFDILIPPIYVIAIVLFARTIKTKNIQQHPEYAFFVKGLLARMIGACSLGLIYYFYYGGGDTINYFETANAYVNLAFKNSSDFLQGWLGNAEGKEYSFFSEETGYPVYYQRDKHSFFVVRLLIPIVFLSCQNYFTSAIMVSVVTYAGLWKLYQTFLNAFPKLQKELAIACLFVPSCLFWGSGIIKDSFTLSAVGWFTYGFYHFFILKLRKPKFALYMLLAAFILLAVKPYIFFALLPGSILYLSNNMAAKIDNAFLRFLIAPLILSLGGITGYYVLLKMGDNLGQYKVDRVLEKAVITQQDLKADYYKGNSFDIGEFDASVGSVISKAPVAIFAGIFRPGLWDVRNPVMLFSALENTYLLLLTLFLLFKLKFFGFFALIRAHPMVMFCMLFSVFFAFSVGLTVANFGTLVRLRIPELPFFVAGIFILRHLYEVQTGKKLKF